MKKSRIGLWIFIAIIAIVGILLIWGVSSYNGLVRARESVKTQYAAVDTQLQRRYDLIPNLVNTVKGYATHEKEVVDSVTEARAKIGSVSNTEERLEAETELSSALNNLLLIVENYPDLKANTNFIQLQDELAGTENRISTERQRYNESVRDYNNKIITFPNSVFANMFGFEKEAYFEAQAGSENPPVVDFNS